VVTCGVLFFFETGKIGSTRREHVHDRFVTCVTKVIDMFFENIIIIIKDNSLYDL